ncbi:MAG TPA: WhiB family transcriptional regulator [Acidimicrobiales bacterium]|nr:WhiB family transcriptional regulator [Acidimicrobiales bacterium]
MDPAELLMQSEVDLAGILTTLLGRPSRHRDAACAEYPIDVFFPDRGEPTEPAKAICAGCLVSEECAGFALERIDLAGVWAGRSQRQRNVARRSVA